MLSESIAIALFISLLWGTTSVVHKELLTRLDKSTLLVVSHFIYALCIIVFIAINYRLLKMEITQKITYRDVGILSFTAAFCGFFANYLYYYVLSKNSSSIITALIYSCPAFTLIIAYFLLNEQVDKYGLLGIFLIVLGVFSISFSGEKIHN